MKIKEASGKEVKKINLWKSREWTRFDKDVGYSWEQKKHVLVAYDNKEIVGFLEFKITGGASYLSELLILKEKRRSGIGTGLLKEFEKISRRERCHVAYLETSTSHKSAIPFYKKNGYKVIAKLKNNKYHLDWCFLEKRLKR